MSPSRRTYASLAIAALLALAAAPGTVLGAGVVGGDPQSSRTGAAAPAPDASDAAQTWGRSLDLPAFAALPADDDLPPEGNIPPLIDPLNPTIDATHDFALSDCKGQKSKIKSVAVTDAVVVGKAGPVYFAGYAHTRAETTKGWGWSFTCILDVESVSATGAGGLARKVTLVSTVNGLHENGDECVYDGLTQESCTAGAVPGEYVLSISGETWGYPTIGESCVGGYAQNAPQYNVNDPVWGISVFPTVRSTFDGCSNDAICWSGCGDLASILEIEGVGEILEDLGFQDI